MAPAKPFCVLQLVARCLWVTGNVASRQHLVPYQGLLPAEHYERAVHPKRYRYMRSPEVKA